MRNNTNIAIGQVIVTEGYVQFFLPSQLGQNDRLVGETRQVANNQAGLRECHIY
jgi:uncharacterized protein YjeT (DUF2065 family)